ncbi:MAG: SDR family oxidoreductase [Alphaproteobacteria bacterium]|jgi:NAD(P)-dependent dehydrogenase (short-subunit alcohol dehydrogenase family)|nr:SDR family oxidoreductase [Alphaproteobacteria bacterium]
MTRKVALVTGAAKRIGRAIALDLARSGWAVAVHYANSSAAAEDACREIAELGGEAAAFRADLSREEEMQALLPAVAEGLGPPALLVNNASTFFNDGIHDATRDSWDRHIETNLRAPFVLTLAFARGLPAGTPGCVINMIDQKVWNLTPHFLSYTVSKCGLWTLTRTLAMALAPQIRVNGIGPGPTLPSARQSEEHFRQQWQSVPLERRTTPEDICRAVHFILAAPAMTGQMIALDGGEHLGWAQAKSCRDPHE